MVVPTAAAPLLPLKMEKKVYETVVIDCSSPDCVKVVFDKEFWRFEVKNEERDEWQVELPGGKKQVIVNLYTCIDSILRERILGQSVRIRKLVLMNWSGDSGLFRGVHIDTLQLVFANHVCPPGFLRVFQQKKFDQLTIFNFNKHTNFLDDLKDIEVDNLRIELMPVDDKNRLAGFKAKQWKVVEHCAEGAFCRQPLILEFIDKMLTEQPPCRTHYETRCFERLDLSELLEGAQKKYPNAELCAVGKRSLSIKLAKKEINVYQIPLQTFVGSPYRYGVIMEPKGAAKRKETMGCWDAVKMKYVLCCMWFVAMFNPALKQLEGRFPRLPIFPLRMTLDYLMHNPPLLLANLFLWPTIVFTFLLSRLDPRIAFLCLAMTVFCLCLNFKPAYIFIRGAVTCRKGAPTYEQPSNKS